MIFKIGDVVRIKDNAWEIGHKHLGFPVDMNEFCGKPFVVREITVDGYYKLENVKADNDYINGDGHWKWAEEWLEENKEIKDIEESEVMSLFE